MEAQQEGGYTKAHIQQEGTFDAGAYSFFGDMAPLDEGLGGALEDGLDAPPEEWPAAGALDDEEDLPIEALMDEEEEDEDLSLAALLRRQMLAQQCLHDAGESNSKVEQQVHTQQHADSAATDPSMLNGLSKAAVQHVQHQHQQPLLPPMPPQPSMLGHLAHHQQQQHPSPAAALPATPSSAPPAGAVVPASAAAAAAAPPAVELQQPRSESSGMMSAAELEARMLSSANQAAQPPPAAGGQLLSMLKAGALGSGKDTTQQQQQFQQLPQQPSPLQMPGGLMAGALPPPGHPAMGPPAGYMQGMPPPGAPPPSSLDALNQMQQQHFQQQQQQRPLLPPQGPLNAQQAPGGPYGMQSPMGHGYGAPHAPHPGPMPMPPMPLPGGPGAGPPPPGAPGMPPMGPGGLLPHPPHPHPMGPGVPPPHMHPGMGPPLQAGPGMPPMGPGVGPGVGPGLPPPTGMGPGGWPGGPPGGMTGVPPPRGPPLPGQLMPPRPMPPPGFPGAPTPPLHQQPPPGFKAPLPPVDVGLSGGLGPQQQQQQQQGPGPRKPSPPRQQQQAAAGSWGRPGGPGQQQQQGAGMQQRFPSPGGGMASGGFGGGYDPTAYGMSSTGPGAGAGVGGSDTPAQLVHRVRTYGSEMMAADEINYILRIQHMATHGGHPYLEDFYYQAFLNKYYGGRNALIFAPSELRDLAAEDHEHGGTEPRFADLSGLGKIVLSNIRTPKMLMDVGSTHGDGSSKAAAGGGGAGQHQVGEGKARPLEQEPMLAARIMIEDCMLLLSDVEDIDRMFAAAAAATAAGGAPQGTAGPISPNQAHALLHRRAALLGGIAASFRLPDEPMLPAEAAAAASGAAATAGGDGVFVRLMGLPKGRALVSKTLRLMFTAPPSAAGKGSKGGAAAAAADGTAEAAAAGSDAADSSSSTAAGLDVIWALLRNAEQAFGPAAAATTGGEAERRMTDATIALSAAAAEMIKRLTQPGEAVACLAAYLSGLERPSAAAAAAAAGVSSQGNLLPLFPAGRVASDASPDWLGGILASLLLRASELGLGSFAASGNVRTLGEGYDKEARELVEQEAKEASGAASGAAAAEWQGLLRRFTERIMLHLWDLIQAAKSGGMVAAAGAPGGVVDVRQFVQKLASVPLMRVLMAHCDAEQQEQLRSYLSEVSQYK